MSDLPGNITALLRELRGGSREAETQLLELVYHELHRVAERLMRSERIDHTLQPTALVNEAYIRLLSGAEGDWQDRAHFFAVAAQVMRRILIDHARANRAGKRGGSLKRIDLDEPLLFVVDNAEDLIAVDEALNRLTDWDARQSKIVELRFFVGLSEDEIAEVLQISVRTVKRDWKIARAWLYAQLKTDELRTPER